jgi:hypothetical protein
MSEKDSQFTLEFLKKNVYYKLKRKIQAITFQVEFNTLMNLLKDTKSMRTFFFQRNAWNLCRLWK